MKSEVRIACALVLGALVTACSSTSSPKAVPHGDAGPTLRERPMGPAADVSRELTGGKGPFIAAASGLSVPDGYVAHEYVAAGTATAYDPTGALTDDGRWTFAPSTDAAPDGGKPSAAYRTRVLVLRPANAASASGTVVVEWLNVSGGADANPEYTSLSEEIARRGDIWVGVSAQLIGVEGGPVLVKVDVSGAGDVAGKGLVAIDPARYGSLVHPGDGYSFDIFTQTARAVLNGGDILGGAKPTVMLAAGESQSAFALTTYYDGVQPLTRMFDGFFVHSRGAQSLPLVAPGAYADLTAAITSTAHPVFRDDLDAPIVDLQAESDVTGILNSGVVRQPNSDKFRLWEVAGTAHADAHLLGSIASTIDCGVPINNGPMHFVAKAAFNGLDTWVRTGKAPPIAPRLELTEDGGTPGARRDADGIALGGIRTPPVDVPVDALSGVPGPNPDLICLLLGSTPPLSEARIAALYANRAAYVQQYAADADRTIQSGFVLQADRDALIAFSQPTRVKP